MNITTIELRDWRYGGYVVSEISSGSIDHVLISKSFTRAMSKAKGLAREAGVKKIMVTATVEV